MKKQKTTLSLIIVALLGAFTLFSGCKVETNPSSNNGVDGTAEVARLVSEIMASIDEMGGSSGTIQAMATCYGNGFSACAGNSVLRTFSSCTTGTITFNGTVSFNWGGPTAAACTMNNPGDSITRNPNYSETGGLRTGILNDFQSGGVEKITLSTNSGTKTFTYTNGGTRRTISTGGTLLFDMSVSTAPALGISGQNRAGRIITGGTLELVDNIIGTICTLQPQNVNWADPNCTCASQGSWIGTCGKTGLIRMDMNGCGTATMTMGNFSEGVQLDRCTNM